MREATLYSLLSQLAGGQVYPYVVPLTEGKPAVSPPWLVFSVVSDTASDVLDGQAESRIPCRSMSGQQYLMTQMISVSRRLMR